MQSGKVQAHEFGGHAAKDQTPTFSLITFFLGKRSGGLYERVGGTQ